MGKNQKRKDLKFGRRSPLLAVSLVAALAAAGCTTNRTLGSGTPVRSGGAIRTAPTSGVTSGSERATPPPMTSSYTGSSGEVRTMSRADAAAAIMAQHQAERGQYLGVTSPGVSGRPYVSDQQTSARLANPALLTNPQLTVNSTISSGPNSVVTSGAGGAAADAVAAGALFSDDAVLGSTTAAGLALTPGAFAGTAVSPVQASANNPTPTTAASSVVAGTAAGTGVAASVTTPAASSVAAPASTNAPSVAATAAVAPSPLTLRPVSTASGDIRVVRSSNGKVVVTNTGRNR